MSEIFETAIVQKRNVLNELRSNNMTLQELRFFSIYLARINPFDISTRAVRFPVEDFRKIMGFGRLNLNQLKESTDSLLSKIVHVPDEQGGFLSFTLFKRCRVSHDSNREWFVEIDASDDALPLMFDFKNKYFKYALWNALRLKSPNQVRMYEILKQYEGLGKREITVIELRELLGISKTEYADRTGWSNFKKKVLDSCKEALEQTTDICYTYERGKVGKGGKWLSIIFYIKKNTNHVDQLTLEEFIKMQPVPEVIDMNNDVDTDTNIGDYDISETAHIIQEPVDVQILGHNERHDEYKDIDFYRSACDDEFSENEIQSILTLLNSIELPENEFGNNFAKYHYLLEKYNKFKAVADRTKIANRYRYFYTMIENERDKQLAYT